MPACLTDHEVEAIGKNLNDIIVILYKNKAVHELKVLYNSVCAAQSALIGDNDIAYDYAKKALKEANKALTK